MNTSNQGPTTWVLLISGNRTMFRRRVSVDKLKQATDFLLNETAELTVQPAAQVQADVAAVTEQTEQPVQSAQPESTQSPESVAQVMAAPPIVPRGRPALPFRGLVGKVGSTESPRTFESLTELAQIVGSQYGPAWTAYYLHCKRAKLNHLKRPATTYVFRKHLVTVFGKNKAANDLAVAALTDAKNKTLNSSN